MERKPSTRRFSRQRGIKVRRLIAILGVLIMSALGLVFTAPAASANPTFNGYTPTHGEVIADVHGDFFELTLAFSYTQAQRDALQQTSEFLEIDFVVTGVTIPGDSQDYEVYGNLPGAQEDVGFHDTTFTPSVTMIQTKDIQANTHYWATVKFHSGVNGTPMLSAQFVPSAWHKQIYDDVVQWGACAVGKVRWDGAWCLFPVEGARVLLTENFYSGTIPIDGSHYTLDPSFLDYARNFA